MAWAGSQSSMQAFEDRHGVTFPSLNDQTGELFARFGVPGQPAWVFIAPDGSTSTVLGALSESKLDAELQRIAEAA